MGQRQRRLKLSLSRSLVTHVRDGAFDADQPTCALRLQIQAAGTGLLLLAVYRRRPAWLRNHRCDQPRQVQTQWFDVAAASGM